MVRMLNSDDDIIVRRAAASAILISLRPYNVDNAKTVAIIAGANLRLVRSPLLPSLQQSICHHVCLFVKKFM